jgi:hypothetical protein
MCDKAVIFASMTPPIDRIPKEFGLVVLRETACLGESLRKEFIGVKPRTGDRLFGQCAS